MSLFKKLKLHLIWLTCFSCMSLVLLKQVFLPQKMLAKTHSSSEVQKSLSEIELKEIALKISVKIETSDNKPLGTGVIVRQENLTEVLNLNQKPGYIYTVLTANHVIKKQLANNKAISIETHDHYQRLINLDSAIQIGTNDLALFHFVSVNQYSTARWGSSNNLNKVFSAGFPCEVDFCEGKLTLTSGIVAPSTILAEHKSFQGGFSIGHDSDIYNGMSGGAILNTDGSLVGINNRKKYPPLIFGNSEYRYQDGSRPSKLVADIIPFFAWGISIETYIEFAEQPNISVSDSVLLDLEKFWYEKFQDRLKYLAIAKDKSILFLPILLVLFLDLSILLYLYQPKSQNLIAQKSLKKQSEQKHKIEEMIDEV